MESSSGATLQPAAMVKRLHDRAVKRWRQFDEGTGAAHLHQAVKCLTYNRRMS
jgi:hypothetical protein